MTPYVRHRRALLFGTTGALVTFAFGSLWGVLTLREHMEQEIGAELNRAGRSVFATLDSSRQLSRWGRTYYFYTYSGYLDNQPFRKEEQVGADIFFLLSEGKNVPVRAYRDDSGQILARIPQNSVPYATNLKLLRTLCLILALGGLVLVLPAVVGAFGRRPTP